jgi:hypothetical protein
MALAHVERQEAGQREFQRCRYMKDVRRPAAELRGVFAAEVLGAP